MNSVKSILGITSVTLLTACATQSGVVPLGEDMYNITNQGNGIWVQPSELKTKALREAQGYCEGKGKALKVVNTVERPSGLLGKWPEGEVLFKCV